MVEQNQRYPSEVELNQNDEPISAEDWLGNRFAVGDLVLYCISAGRGQMLALGKVVKLRINEGSKTAQVRNPKTTHLSNEELWRLSYNERYLVVDVPQAEWLIEVQILTERTSGYWNNERRTRPAWVNEMNITAVQGFESILK